MKRPFNAVVVCGVCAVVVGVGGITYDAQAGIGGVNTPVTSSGSIIFDDTLSSTPPAGITNTGPVVSPWNGSPVTLTLTTDPNTLDFASGSLDATYVLNGNNYAININGITLNQAVGNTGLAQLDVAFNIEFQLDALGLPQQVPIYPNFVVNGTVQNTAGSFAALSGYIDYYGVNTAGTYSVLETVNYNAQWLTPGPFSSIVFGVPVNGFVPMLVGNTTFTLDGLIRFKVDPASINAYSIQSVPEPASIISLGAAAGWLATRRGRRAVRPSA